MSGLRTHPQKWFEDLFDSNAEWIELTPALSEQDPQMGDEVITGLSTVSGRRVGLIAHNNLVDQGYISSRGAEKILKLMNLAHEMGIPILSLMSSPGISIKEGLAAGDAYAKVLRRTCELSGIVPQFCAVVGVCVGAPAYSAVLQDVTVFNRLRSHMMVSAPGVVQAVLGEEATLGELGGAQMHSETTGLAHFVEDSVRNQLLRLRFLVQYFPSHYLDDPDSVAPALPERPMAQIPQDPKVTFEVRDVLAGLVDRSVFHEYGSAFGRSVVTAWSHLNGQPVGWIANNSMAMAGSLNVDSSEKAARFIRLCDAYNIPIVTLIDTPGFMPGVNEEHRGLLKSGAKLCRAMQTRVPRLSVVLRKSYGAAAIVLTQTPGWGGDGVLALDQSSCAVMGFGAARLAMYGSQELTAEQLEKLEQEYRRQHEDPVQTYRKGYIDRIVSSDQLRDVLVQTLGYLKDKLDKPRPPVRGIEL